jgi:hypothetical protein
VRKYVTIVVLNNAKSVAWSAEVRDLAGRPVFSGSYWACGDKVKQEGWVCKNVRWPNAVQPR